ncbi:MAG: PLP-dependent aspartate aminotransferase family protein [Halanaeroarchaeum sp.]
MDETGDRHFDTLAVRYGEYASPDGDPGDVVVPIHLSSTFALPGLDAELSIDDVNPDDGEFVYSRLSNPTRHALERRLAALEGGETAYAFASGTAAIASAVLSVVEPGDHLVAFDDLYAGTRRMFEGFVDETLGIDVEFVDATSTDAVATAVTEETALVWMETPTNPLMRLCDVEAIADISHDADAVFGVDNTFASPAVQRPLDLGADVVAHSTTKYLNGHSDSVGGALITDDPAVAEAVEFNQRVALGNVLAPFDSYMVLRGLKTLGPRMERHQTNAGAIANYLAEHDRVETVHYPGHDSHPQAALARRQMDGGGGILSFELDGDRDDATAFLEALEEFTLAVSLGGVESLVELPAAMTHEPISKEERLEIGITDSLIRVSVGIEHVDDLIADLDRGFAAIERR